MVASADAGPRILIRRLRQIMSEPGEAQPRLDEIVKVIAGLMVAEVCSIYMTRPDGSMELFATEGLNASAVHKTHMQKGEGLVGLIATNGEVVNLQEAPKHPAFSYRPETGEEIYHSFLGVPIQRAGHVVGVLVVQNTAPRHYEPEEEEAMQTTAMVLAQYVAQSEVAGLMSQGASGQKGRAVMIAGQTLSEGIALGHVVMHEPRVVIKDLVADDMRKERLRLARAIRRMRQVISEMLKRRDLAAPGEHREVLETYQMFAHDRGWIGRLREAIEKGLTAEAAVERVRNDTRARMLRRADAYWRERFRDFDDLSDRLLRILVGRDRTSASEALPDDTILVARTMGPAELLDYDRSKLRALVIEEGGLSSHVAIVAKALGIAALGHAVGIMDTVEAGDNIIVDAEKGELHLRPGPDVIAAFADRVRFRARRQQRYAGLRELQAVTKDGVRVGLFINAGLIVDLPHLAQSGADGIGLFRTELEFMISAKFPLKDRQTGIYQKIIEGAGDRPVVFRSLDIGGDKLLPYMKHDKEENPALGWRSVRMSLDQTGLFRTQISALIRAAAGRDLKVMLPMITDISEYHQAKALVERQRVHLEKVGREMPRKIEIGAMLEVPSLLFQLDSLFHHADFVSIGSNDLMQYFFAADRNNDKVSSRYDPLSRPALRALKKVTETARKHKTPLTLCGEIAGRPLEAMALLGIGIPAVSMAPASIGPVKAMVLSLDVGKLSKHIDKLLEQDQGDIRQELKVFAAENGVEVDPQAPSAKPG